jgi:N-acyl homoserine lactone hydrolase
MMRDDSPAAGPAQPGAVLPPLADDAPPVALYPLVLGTMDVPRRTLYAGGGDATITVPLMSCLIIDHGQAVLVDNGYDLSYLPKYTFAHTFRDDSLAAALRAHGLEYGDVATMVNTHLHSDHAGMNRVFENAEIVVQESEYRFAFGPTAQQGHAYRPTSGFARIPAERFRLVTGNVPLSPSVWLLHTPGHTPGHQSVLARTGSGWVIFTGDACHARSILDGGPQAELVFDQTGYDNSLRVIRESGLTAVFAHDLDFVNTAMKPAY